MSDHSGVRATGRRRWAGLLGLFAAIALLVAVKAGSAPARRPAALAPLPPPGAGPAGSATGPGGGPAPAAGNPTGPGPAGGPAGASPSGPANATGRRILTGNPIDTPFGPVQVSVNLQGRRIVDVTAVQLPNRDGRCVEISDYAAPQLRQEVLTAQSAQIDAVSGASYTSDGYAQSVQSALDTAFGANR